MVEGKGKIKRQEFLLFANVGVADTPEWEVIGDEIEELSVETNNEVDSKTDILGQTKTTVKKGPKSTSVDPYIVKRESKLGQKLYEMIRNDAELDDVKMDFLQVWVFDSEAGKYSADRQQGMVDIKSYGGDTGGFGIPFDVHLVGEKTPGTFDPATKTFTPVPAV